MGAGLVQRLRDLAARKHTDLSICAEAAERIETLEASLRYVLDRPKNPRVFALARQALEEPALNATMENIAENIAESELREVRTYEEARVLANLELIDRIADRDPDLPAGDDFGARDKLAQAIWKRSPASSRE